MNIYIENLNAGDEKFNRLLAFLDGEDIKYSTQQPALPQAHVSGSDIDWDSVYDESDDEEWDEDDEEERRYEEECEIAATCTCGAWQFNSKGQPVHIADCYCGAE